MMQSLHRVSVYECVAFIGISESGHVCASHSFKMAIGVTLPVFRESPMDVFIASSSATHIDLKLLSQEPYSLSS